MPDSVTPSRPSPDATANGVRLTQGHPSGLPIFCTERLTNAERKGLEALIEQHQTQANLLKLALLAGTVAGALGAMRVGVLLGQAEETMSLKLGSNR